MVAKTKHRLRLGAIGKPRMKLVDNWRKVLRHSSCLQLIALAAVLSGAEAVLPLVDYRIPGPPWAHAAVLFVVVGCAGVARLVAQEAVSGK